MRCDHMPFAYGCTIANFAWFVNCFRFRPQKEVLHTIEFENSLQSSLKQVLIRTLFGFWCWFWVDEVEIEKKKYLYFIQSLREWKYFQSNFELKKEESFVWFGLEWKGIFLLGLFLKNVRIVVTFVFHQKKIKLRYSVVLRGEQLHYFECKKDFWTELLLFNNWILGQFLKQL